MPLKITFNTFSFVPISPLLPFSPYLPFYSAFACIQSSEHLIVTNWVIVTLLQGNSLLVSSVAEEGNGAMERLSEGTTFT